MNQKHGVKQKYNIWLFYGVSFLITWAAGGILSYQSWTTGDKNIGILFLAYMGPLLGAIGAMVLKKDTSITKDFISRLFRIKGVDKKYICIMLTLMPLSMIGAILLSVFFFGQPLSQLQFSEALMVFDGERMLSVMILAFVPVLEELGWRGYGVDALKSKYSLFGTSLFFGLLWGLWHLPVFFIKGSYQASLWQENPLYVINFFLGIMALAFIMNWLFYKSKRSVLVLAIFHITVNYSSEIFRANQISKILLTLILVGISLVIVTSNKVLFFDEKGIEICL